MAMIGVPFMNNNINPYKQQQQKRTVINNERKSSSMSLPARRRYQSESVPDNATKLKPDNRIRYKSECDNNNLSMYGKNGRIKSSSSPNLDQVIKKSKVLPNDQPESHSNQSGIESNQNKERVKRKISAALTTVVSLPPITEEKCPSLSELSEISIIEEMQIVSDRDKVGRRRSLSENAVIDLKNTQQTVGKWKRWNPINKLWHQLKGSNNNNNNNNSNRKAQISSSSTDTAQSSLTNIEQSSCNCIR